jgi:hypothetical protein
MFGLALVIGVAAVSDISVAAPLPPASAALEAAHGQAAPVELAQYRHRHCFYRHHRRYCR